MKISRCICDRGFKPDSAIANTRCVDVDECRSRPGKPWLPATHSFVLRRMIVHIFKLPFVSPISQITADHMNFLTTSSTILRLGLQSTDIAYSNSSSIATPTIFHFSEIYCSILIKLNNSSLVIPSLVNSNNFFL